MTFRRNLTAQPTTGTAFSITDEALAVIDEHVASHRPERGGAMIALADSRYVVGFVPDPRQGEHVHYWHSDQLRGALAQHLAAHPKHRYVGTLHSHPGGYAEPSGDDHRSYASLLSANAAVRESLFPIVVQADRCGLGSTLRLGERHLVDLPHGTFAGYSAAPTPDGVVEVRPAPMHVVPLRRHSEHAAGLLADRLGLPVSAGATGALEIEGRLMATVPIQVDGQTRVTVIFPEIYPSVAPLLWSSSGRIAAPAWIAGADEGKQLADAVLGLVEQEARPVDDGERLEARLAVHLPGGARSRYLVVGAGSVGSTAAEMLVRSGVKQLAVLDYDTVSGANLSRSVYTRSDVGRLKVDALAARLTAIAPDAQIVSLPHSIRELDAADLTDVDVVVLAADDLASEFWLAHHLYRRGIKAVSIKMFTGGDAGEIAVVDPEAGTACLHCMIGAFAAADRGATDYGTGRIEGAPALGPDILATVSRGIRLALALGQAEGPLADWLRPLIEARRTYFQQSSIAGWKYLAPARPGGESPVYDSMWATTMPQQDCPVCGMEPEEPQAATDLSFPDEVPDASELATA